MPCLGRVIGEELPFEQGGSFHVTFQCTTRTQASLCDTCENKLKYWSSKADKGRGIQVGRVAGLVNEPIPDWAHVYGGNWFRLKLEGGFTLSEMVKAKVSTKAPAAKEPAAKAPAAKLSAEKVLESLPVVPKPVKVTKAPKAPEQGPKVRVKGSIDTSDHEVIHIKVRKQVIDGREFYVDAENNLYDMKFKSCEYPSQSHS
jgi:hypothetical protein